MISTVAGPLRVALLGTLVTAHAVPAASNLPTNAYFGKTHMHSEYSLDADGRRSRTRPEIAR